MVLGGGSSEAGVEIGAFDVSGEVPGEAEKERGEFAELLYRVGDEELVARLAGCEAVPSSRGSRARAVASAESTI